MESIFEALKTLNVAGVYLLVNLESKEVYVSYSSNIAGALVRLLSSNMFFPKFQFNILELVTDSINLRPRCQFYKDLYSSNGYTLLNPKRVSNWKLRIESINDFRDKAGKSLLFVVNLYSGAYKRLTVGIFESYESLQSFIDLHYARNLVTRIVYADNELTREYLKKWISLFLHSF